MNAGLTCYCTYLISAHTILIRVGRGYQDKMCLRNSRLHVPRTSSNRVQGRCQDCSGQADGQAGRVGKRCKTRAGGGIGAGG